MEGLALSVVRAPAIKCQNVQCACAADGSAPPAVRVESSQKITLANWENHVRFLPSAHSVCVPGLCLFGGGSGLWKLLTGHSSLGVALRGEPKNKTWGNNRRGGRRG